MENVYVLISREKKEKKNPPQAISATIVPRWQFTEITDDFPKQ